MSKTWYLVCFSLWEISNYNNDITLFKSEKIDYVINEKIKGHLVAYLSIDFPYSMMNF
jgi:hypothetical protein